MLAARITRSLRPPMPLLVGGLVLSLGVFAAIAALDRNAEQQKQAQLLVAQLQVEITQFQDLPWNADASGRNEPRAVVRAQLRAQASDIRTDVLELQQIGDVQATRKAPTLLDRDAALLERQLLAVSAGNDTLSNDLADAAGAAADRLRASLASAGTHFDVTAGRAHRYTIMGTAALLLVLYLAFALTLVLLVRTQKQSAAKSRRLRQAQKLEAIGQLAGGIAHDFNNLLLAIRGFAELGQASLAPDAPARNDIRGVLAVTDRATELTNQLLAFSRERTLNPTVIDPNAAVSEMARLLERLIGEEIEVELELASEIPHIECDASQLGQVIVNLAVNARDAMPAGGRLTIATARAATCPAGPAADAGPWAVISVSDTGCGIDDCTLDRIFDPFFTTKEAETGTGLGLATVSGIVAQSGGHVVVDTELGRGSTFHVFLPAADTRAETTDCPLLAGGSSAAEGRILVVDDNDTVRMLVARMLEDRGYVVHEARTGDEAVDLFAEADDGVDLLVTDLAMPGMSGQELGRRLGHLPVLYMSGYPRDFDEDDTGRTAFIQKPFAMADLTRAVDELLAAASVTTA